MERLKDSVVETIAAASNSALVARSVSNIRSAAVRGRMPSLNLLRQRVSNAQKRAGPMISVNPQRREDLIVLENLKVKQLVKIDRSRAAGYAGFEISPQCFSQVINDEKFLHFDSGRRDPNRLIVFATDAPAGQPRMVPRRNFQDMSVDFSSIVHSPCETSR